MSLTGSYQTVFPQDLGADGKQARGQKTQQCFRRPGSRQDNSAGHPQQTRMIPKSSSVAQAKFENSGLPDCLGSFFKDFIYLFMRDPKEIETQAEGEAGSLGGAPCRTQSQDPGIVT